MDFLRGADRQINRRLPEAESVSLSAVVKKLEAINTSYDGLRAAVEQTQRREQAPSTT